MCIRDRPVTEHIDQKLEKYGAIIEQRHEVVYRLLRQKAMTLEQLIDLKPIYRRHPDPAPVYRFFEGNMLRQHLAVLQSRGLVHYSEEEKPVSYTHLDVYKRQLSTRLPASQRLPLSPARTGRGSSKSFRLSR